MHNDRRTNVPGALLPGAISESTSSAALALSTEVEGAAAVVLDSSALASSDYVIKHAEGETSPNSSTTCNNDASRSINAPLTSHTACVGVYSNRHAAKLPMDTGVAAKTEQARNAIQIYRPPHLRESSTSVPQQPKSQKKPRRSSNTEAGDCKSGVTTLDTLSNDHRVSPSHDYSSHSERNDSNVTSSVCSNMTDLEDVCTILGAADVTNGLNGLCRPASEGKLQDQLSSLCCCIASTQNDSAPYHSGGTSENREKLDRFSKRHVRTSCDNPHNNVPVDCVECIASSTSLYGVAKPGTQQSDGDAVHVEAAAETRTSPVVGSLSSSDDACQTNGTRCSSTGTSRDEGSSAGHDGRTVRDGAASAPSGTTSSTVESTAVSKKARNTVAALSSARTAGAASAITAAKSAVCHESLAGSVANSDDNGTKQATIVNAVASGYSYNTSTHTPHAVDISNANSNTINCSSNNSAGGANHGSNGNANNNNSNNNIYNYVSTNTVINVVSPFTGNTCAGSNGRSTFSTHKLSQGQQQQHPKQPCLTNAERRISPHTLIRSSSGMTMMAGAGGTTGSTAPMHHLVNKPTSFVSSSVLPQDFVATLPYYIDACLTPSTYDIARRDQLFQTVQAVARETLGRSIHVQIHGSVVTGLALSASDIDLFVSGYEPIPSLEALQRLSSALLQLTEQTLAGTAHATMGRSDASAMSTDSRTTVGNSNGAKSGNAACNGDCSSSEGSSHVNAKNIINSEANVPGSVPPALRKSSKGSDTQGGRGEAVCAGSGLVVHAPESSDATRQSCANGVMCNGESVRLSKSNSSSSSTQMHVRGCRDRGVRATDDDLVVENSHTICSSQVLHPKHDENTDTSSKNADDTGVEDSGESSRSKDSVSCCQSMMQHSANAATVSCINKMAAEVDCNVRSQSGRVAIAHDTPCSVLPDVAEKEMYDTKDEIEAAEEVYRGQIEKDYNFSTPCEYSPLFAAVIAAGSGGAGAHPHCRGRGPSSALAVVGETGHSHHVGGSSPALSLSCVGSPAATDRRKNSHGNNSTAVDAIHSQNCTNNNNSNSCSSKDGNRPTNSYCDAGSCHCGSSIQVSSGGTSLCFSFQPSESNNFSTRMPMSNMASATETTAQNTSMCFSNTAATQTNDDGEDGRHDGRSKDISRNDVAAKSIAGEPGAGQDKSLCHSSSRYLTNVSMETESGCTANLGLALSSTHMCYTQQPEVSTREEVVVVSKDETHRVGTNRESCENAEKGQEAKMPALRGGCCTHTQETAPHVELVRCGTGAADKDRSDETSATVVTAKGTQPQPTTTTTTADRVQSTISISAAAAAAAPPAASPVAVINSSNINNRNINSNSSDSVNPAVQCSSAGLTFPQQQQQQQQQQSIFARPGLSYLSYVPVLEGELLYIQTIISTRVPVIKITDKMTGMRADVTFAGGHHWRSMKFTRDLINSFPHAQRLILFLKHCVRCLGISESEPGGVTSFAIYLMVRHFFNACTQHVVSILYKEFHEPDTSDSQQQQRRRSAVPRPCVAGANNNSNKDNPGGNSRSSSRGGGRGGATGERGSEESASHATHKDKEESVIHENNAHGCFLGEGMGDDKEPVHRDANDPLKHAQQQQPLSGRARNHPISPSITPLNSSASESEVSRHITRSGRVVTSVSPPRTASGTSLLSTQPPNDHRMNIPGLEAALRNYLGHIRQRCAVDGTPSLLPLATNRARKSSATPTPTSMKKAASSMAETNVVDDARTAATTTIESTNSSVVERAIEAPSATTHTFPGATTPADRVVVDLESVREVAATADDRSGSSSSVGSTTSALSPGVVAATSSQDEVLTMAELMPFCGEGADNSSNNNNTNNSSSKQEENAHNNNTSSSVHNNVHANDSSKEKSNKDEECDGQERTLTESVEDTTLLLQNFAEDFLQHNLDLSQIFCSFCHYYGYAFNFETEGIHFELDGNSAVVAKPFLCARRGQYFHMTSPFDPQYDITARMTCMREFQWLCWWFTTYTSPGARNPCSLQYVAQWLSPLTAERDVMATYYRFVNCATPQIQQQQQQQQQSGQPYRSASRNHKATSTSACGSPLSNNSNTVCDKGGITVTAAASSPFHIGGMGLGNMARVVTSDGSSTKTHPSGAGISDSAHSPHAMSPPAQILAPCHSNCYTSTPMVTTDAAATTHSSGDRNSHAHTSEAELQAIDDTFESVGASPAYVGGHVRTTVPATAMNATLLLSSTSSQMPDEGGGALSEGRRSGRRAASSHGSNNSNTSDKNASSGRSSPVSHEELRQLHSQPLIATSTLSESLVRGRQEPQRSMYSNNSSQSNHSGCSGRSNMCHLAGRSASNHNHVNIGDQAQSTNINCLSSDGSTSDAMCALNGHVFNNNSYNNSQPHHTHSPLASNSLTSSPCSGQGDSADQRTRAAGTPVSHHLDPAQCASNNNNSTAVGADDVIKIASREEAATAAASGRGAVSTFGTGARSLMRCANTALNAQPSTSSNSPLSSPTRGTAPTGASKTVTTARNRTGNFMESNNNNNNSNNSISNNNANSNYLGGPAGLYNRVRYRSQPDAGAVTMDRVNSVNQAYPFAMTQQQQHQQQQASSQGCGMAIRNYDTSLLTPGDGSVFAGVNVSGNMHNNTYNNSNGGLVLGHLGNDCGNGMDSFGPMMMPSLQQQQQSMSIASSTQASHSSLQLARMPQRTGHELPPMRGMNNRIALPMNINNNGNTNVNGVIHNSNSMNMITSSMNSASNYSSNSSNNNIGMHNGNGSAGANFGCFNARYQPMTRRGFAPGGNGAGYDINAEMMQSHNQGANNNGNGMLLMMPTGQTSNCLCQQTINSSTNNYKNNITTNDSVSNINANTSANNSNSNNTNGSMLPGRSTSYSTYAPMAGPSGAMMEPNSVGASSMGMGGYMNPSFSVHTCPATLQQQQQQQSSVMGYMGTMGRDSFIKPLAGGGMESHISEGGQLCGWRTRAQEEASMQPFYSLPFANNSANNNNTRMSPISPSCLFPTPASMPYTTPGQPGKQQPYLTAGGGVDATSGSGSSSKHNNAKNNNNYYYSSNDNATVSSPSRSLLVHVRRGHANNNNSGIHRTGGAGGGALTGMIEMVSGQDGNKGDFIEGVSGNAVSGSTSARTRHALAAGGDEVAADEDNLSNNIIMNNINNSSSNNVMSAVDIMDGADTSVGHGHRRHSSGCVANGRKPSLHHTSSRGVNQGSGQSTSMSSSSISMGAINPVKTSVTANITQAGTHTIVSPNTIQSAQQDSRLYGFHDMKMNSMSSYYPQQQQQQQQAPYMQSFNAGYGLNSSNSNVTHAMDWCGGDMGNISGGNCVKAGSPAGPYPHLFGINNVMRCTPMSSPSRYGNPYMHNASNGTNNSITASNSVNHPHPQQEQQHMLAVMPHNDFGPDMSFRVSEYGYGNKSSSNNNGNGRGVDSRANVSHTKGMCAAGKYPCLMGQHPQLNNTLAGLAFLGPQQALDASFHNLNQRTSAPDSCTDANVHTSSIASPADSKQTTS